MLFPQDGVDCLQKFLSALRRAEKGKRWVALSVCHCVESSKKEQQTGLNLNLNSTSFRRKSSPAAQVKRPLWSSFWFWFCVNYFTHSRTLTVCGIQTICIIHKEKVRLKYKAVFSGSSTCVWHGSDLKGICRNHMTETERIFFFRRYRNSMWAALKLDKYIYIKATSKCCLYSYRMHVPFYVKTYNFLLLLGLFFAYKHHSSFENWKAEEDGRHELPPNNH